MKSVMGSVKPFDLLFERAAAYGGMSTENQVYSTAKRLDSIQMYAALHSLDL